MFGEIGQNDVVIRRRSGGFSISRYGTIKPSLDKCTQDWIDKGVDNSKNPENNARSRPYVVFVVRSGLDHVHRNKLSFESRDADNKKDVVDRRKDQTEHVHSSSTERTSHLRNDGEQDGDNDNGDSRQLSLSEKRRTKDGKARKGQSSQNVEDDQDANVGRRKSQGPDDGAHDDPSGEVDKVKSKVHGQKTRKLRVPRLLRRRHCFDKLRDAALSFFGHLPRELVRDATDANVQGSAHDVDESAHVQRADSIIILFLGFIGKGILVGVGYGGGSVDGGNGLVNGALERQNVDLDVIVLLFDEDLLPQGAVRPEGIVPALSLALVGA